MADAAPPESSSPLNATTPVAEHRIDQREARGILGASVGMFEYWTRHGPITTGRWAPKPAGEPGRRRVYDRAEIERLAVTIRRRRDARAAHALPEGHVDRDRAARMFGVAPMTWRTWIRLGKVPPGTVMPDPRGGRRSVYTLEELQRIREAKETPDPNRPYRDPSQPAAFVLPAGTVRREDAWRLFGVSMNTWVRWERDALVNCGEILQVTGGGRLKVYPLAELKRLLARFGRFAPPYPDPDRPGCVRVPLAGRGIRRREAIIDAADLPLIEAGTCSCGGIDHRDGVHVSFHAPDVHAAPLRRLIMRVTDRNHQVGHLNGDPLDCRRANLVVRTVAQRSHTTRKREVVAGRRTTSRFKGVSWELWTGRWRAQIKCDGTARSLGRFRDEIAAAEAYDEAARQMFGEHARLNFPDGVPARLEQDAAAAPTALTVETDPRVAA